MSAKGPEPKPAYPDPTFTPSKPIPIPGPGRRGYRQTGDGPATGFHDGTPEEVLRERRRNATLRP